MQRICFLFLIIIASWMPVSAQEKIEDSTYNFSFVAPDSSWTKTKGLAKTDLYTFTRTNAEGQPSFLNFRKLDEVVTTDGSDERALVDHKDEYIQKSNLPLDTQITFQTAQCKDRTLYGYAAVMSKGDRSVFTEVINVPLLPNAIQVLVSGPLAEIDSLKELMKSTIANMDGRTYAMNVTHDPVSPWEHFGTAALQFVILLGIIWGVGLLIKSGKSKSKPPQHGDSPANK